VLMASAVVVLKHKTSTLHQRHHFISNDFKFCVGDNVWDVTSPDKVGSDPISGRDDTWGQHNTGPVIFLFSNRATAQTREPIFALNSSKDAVWCKEDPFGDEKCVVPVCNKTSLSRKPKVTMKFYQEVMVPLSESVI